MDDAREARLLPRRLRLHDLHRQLRPGPRRDRGGGQGRQPRRRLGALGQPQLRGPREPGRARELPRVAAARRRLRARRHDEHRPRHRAARHRQRRQAGVPARHLAVARPRSPSAMRTAIKREQFEQRYAHVLDGDADWRALQVPAGDTFAWDDKSTYIRKPPFFDDLGPTPKPLTDITGARVLAMLGDSVTTDHISPAGNIAKGTPGRAATSTSTASPARLQPVRRAPRQPRGDGARHVREHPPQEPDAPGRRGRLHQAHARPATQQLAIYDAAMQYQAEGVPLDRASPARSTAPAARATGPPRARCCSASAP